MENNIECSESESCVCDQSISKNDKSGVFWGTGSLISDKNTPSPRMAFMVHHRRNRTKTTTDHDIIYQSLDKRENKIFPLIVQDFEYDPWDNEHCFTL